MQLLRLQHCLKVSAFRTLADTNTELKAGHTRTHIGSYTQQRTLTRGNEPKYGGIPFSSCFNLHYYCLMSKKIIFCPARMSYMYHNDTLIKLAQGFCYQLSALADCSTSLRRSIRCLFCFDVYFHYQLIRFPCVWLLAVYVCVCVVLHARVGCPYVVHAFPVLYTLWRKTLDSMGNFPQCFYALQCCLMSSRLSLFDSIVSNSVGYASLTDTDSLLRHSLF